MTGWKTLVLQTPADISFHQNCLHVEGEREFDVPLEQLKLLVVEALQIRISAYLINELQRQGVKVVFCNEKHLPSCELVGYHDHFLQGAHIREQMAWTEDSKNELWAHIIRRKIGMQSALLAHLQLPVPPEMDLYQRDVLPGDRTNREGQAARVYFHTLFGKDFVRSEVCDLNASLNYGYSLLLSMVTRKVTAMGCITNIGIAHCSDENPYNLSCDLMEPFRPFIDEIVYYNREKAFGPEIKAALLDAFYESVIYNGMSMQLQTAVDMFVAETLSWFTTHAPTIGELKFA